MSQEVPRILVVDDELGIREGCRKIFSVEGYGVEVACNGLEGLETFKSQGSFSVVLVDLNMPKMGGLELIEHLRELDDDVVIFVITAYATIETAVEATRKGAYGYIPKPFTPDELLLPVRNGLERRALTLESKRLREERERRLLELAVERSRSSTIISGMSDGVLVINRDRQIVLRNAAANRIIPGCDALPQVAGLDALCSSEIQALVDEVLSQQARPGIASKELVFEKLTFLVNVSQVLEPSGEVSGAVAVLRDITPLKQLETAKTLFMSMVAHEFKSPLYAVEGLLSSVVGGVGGPDPERDRHFIERSLLRIKTLQALVSDLLNLTAMETGRFTVNRLPLDITPVLHEVTETCRDHAMDQKIDLSIVDLPADKPLFVLADREALTIVLTNLVDNAIKYSPEGGQVRVCVDRDPSYTRVHIQDNGIGMSPEEQEHVFDEFFRAKNKKAIHVPGTGLGLSLVKRLVDLHQGRISVRSAPDKGSTFTVSLPNCSY